MHSCADRYAPTRSLVVTRDTHLCLFFLGGGLKGEKKEMKEKLEAAAGQHPFMASFVPFGVHLWRLLCRLSPIYGVFCAV
eukprot:297450-Rhodomonas_salina.2